MYIKKQILRKLILVIMGSLLGTFYQYWKLQNVNTRYRQTSPRRGRKKFPELTRHTGNIPIIPAVEKLRQEDNHFEASKSYMESLGQLVLSDKTLSQERGERAEGVVQQKST